MGVADRYVHRRVRDGREVFQIDFVYDGPDGRKCRYQRRAQIQSKVAACSEAEERYILAVKTGDPRLPREKAEPKAAEPAKPPMLTLRRFYETTYTELFLGSVAPSTRDRYTALAKQGLMDVLGDLPLDQIDELQDRRFDAWLQRKKLQTRGPRGFLHALLRCAVEAKALPALPKLLKLPPKSEKLPSAPAREDVDAVLGVAEGWLRTAVALAAFAGLRSGEVRGLQVGDVDLARNRILVQRAISGEANEVRLPKSKKPRPVPIAEPLRPILVEACKGKLPLARVVMMADGELPRRQRVWNELQATQKRHGLQAWSFHAFRHAFCSILAKSGASLEAVRKMAGHSKLSMTERYIHDDDVQAAIARF